MHCFAFGACSKLGARRNKQLRAMKRGLGVCLLSDRHVLIHLFPCYFSTSHSIVNNIHS